MIGNTTKNRLMPKSKNNGSLLEKQIEIGLKPKSLHLTIMEFHMLLPLAISEKYKIKKTKWLKWKEIQI